MASIVSLMPRRQRQDRFAPLGRHRQQTEAERDREHHDRQQQAVGGGLDRIGGNDAEDPVTQARHVGRRNDGAAVPRIEATVAASTCIHANIGGTTTRLMTAKVISSDRKVASVRRPTARTLWKSVDAAIPTISSDPTSGMTVIRMTLTHSVPIGSISDTRVASGAAG